ncbi:MAG: hypothetical protein IJB11_04905 [Oscillospiraceae bacterium]|nr:hypothetical protein [Oscillospiraceae bacterium]
MEETQALTEISAKQLDYVTQDDLTAREAVEFLLNGMRLRSFRDILKRVCGDDDREQQLISGLCAQAEGPVQPDSIRKKVRNWMSGKSMPTEREDVFKICFALGLDQDRSDRLLLLLTDQGIHYRNGREMIFAYGLRYGLTYPEACALAEQMLSGNREASSRNPMTHVIRQEFQKVRGAEDLFAFILRHKQSLGTSHNTAYAYFTRMLALLTGEDMDGEERYSMEYVADTYLRLNVPLDKKTGGYTDIQKMVKKYWPGAKSVKAMKAGSEDVSRKALLLMYLVTGGVWDQEYDELDEGYIQPKEFLEGHCKRMNHMLRQCGMRRIDPRNPFDYLVLYCLRPEDELFMSDRMAQLAGEIFGT